MKLRAVLVILGAVAVSAAIAFLVLRGTPVGPAGPKDPLEMLPGRCQAVFVAPNPGRLGEHVGLLPRLKLAALLASTAGYPNAEALFADLARQAGWDPRSRESMRGAGIDPDRALVGFLSEKENAPLVLIPEADAGKLEALLAKNAEARLGAPRRTQETVAGTKVTILAGQGPVDQLAWAHASGYLLLAHSPAGVAALKAALVQPAEGSLARDPRFAATRKRLADRDVFAFSCVDAIPLQKRVFVPYGTSLSFALDEKALRLSADLPLDDAWADRLKSLASPAGADLVSRLDPNAFLVARLGGDPALLEPLVDTFLAPLFKRAFEEAGVDVKKDLLGNLKPGVAAAFTLAPTAKLGGVPELDVRRTNPFEFVLLGALGRALDPGRAAKTLEAVAAAAPRFGAKMEPAEVSGAKVFVTRYHLGEGASLGLKADQVLVTGGAGQMEAMLSRLDSPAAVATADPEASRALAEDAFAVYLDLSRLIAGVRSLPDSAYGIGGWAIKAAVSRWLDAVDEITGLRVHGRLADKSLHAEVALTLKLAPLQAEKGPRAP